MSTFEVHRALAAIFDTLAESNRHLQALSPWISTATKAEIHRALYYSSETLRIAGILLKPFMPDKADELLEALGVEKGRRGWEEAVLGAGGEREMLRGGGKTRVLFPPVKLDA